MWLMKTLLTSGCTNQRGAGHNDISMLEAAGTGVAMGNADDAVKARANVVIGDNTTDSIAQYIYTHLL